MARNVELRCDICKQTTNQIVGKLHFTPMVPGVSRGIHSNYTHTADVGACCKDRLFKSFDFRKRMSAKEYAQKRKVGTR
jgi:hypothetical protein